MQPVKFGLKTVVMVILLLIAFFQNWLLSRNPIFGYVDELSALIAILYFVAKVFKGRIQKNKFKIAVLGLVIIFWGLFCNMHFRIQSSYMAIVEDILSNFKFLFIYLGLTEYMKERGFNISKILKPLLFVLKLYLVILVACALVNIVKDINMDAGMRYGFRMFAFVYGTPGHLINQMTYSIIILTAENEYFHKKNNIWKLMCAFIMISTMKTRAFLLIMVYMSLTYFIKYRKKKKLGLELAIVALVAILIGFSQFEYYFQTDGAPRQMFVEGAVKIVKEYFPFGTGFATYGSSGAAEHYSKLYYHLGFSNRWGMTEDNTLFLNDNYLPMIFGEFGLFFALLFLYMIFRYSKMVITDKKRFDSVNCRLITYAFLGDAILSSIQSSYLAHYSVVTLSIMYFLFFYPNKQGKLK